MAKPPKESRDTRKVANRLIREGWTARPGKGDHMNFAKLGCERITLDMGAKEVKKPIYGDIKRRAGWE